MKKNRDTITIHLGRVEPDSDTVLTPHHSTLTMYRTYKESVSKEGATPIDQFKEDALTAIYNYWAVCHNIMVPELYDNFKSQQPFNISDARQKAIHDEYFAFKSLPEFRCDIEKIRKYIRDMVLSSAGDVELKKQLFSIAIVYEDVREAYINSFKPHQGRLINSNECTCCYVHAALRLPLYKEYSKDNRAILTQIDNALGNIAIIKTKPQKERTKDNKELLKREPELVEHRTNILDNEYIGYYRLHIELEGLFFDIKRVFNTILYEVDRYPLNDYKLTFDVKDFDTPIALFCEELNNTAGELGEVGEPQASKGKQPKKEWRSSGEAGENPVSNLSCLTQGELALYCKYALESGVLASFHNIGEGGIRDAMWQYVKDKPLPDGRTRSGDNFYNECSKLSGLTNDERQATYTVKNINKVIKMLKENAIAIPEMATTDLAAAERKRNVKK